MYFLDSQGNRLKIIDQNFHIEQVVVKTVHVLLNNERGRALMNRTLGGEGCRMGLHLTDDAVRGTQEYPIPVELTSRPGRSRVSRQIRFGVGRSYGYRWDGSSVGSDCWSSFLFILS